MYSFLNIYHYLIRKSISLTGIYEHFIWAMHYAKYFT